MYRIVKKEVLNPTVTRMDIEAPLIAKKAKRGSSSSCGWTKRANVSP